MYPPRVIVRFCAMTIAIIILSAWTTGAAAAPRTVLVAGDIAHGSAGSMEAATADLVAGRQGLVLTAGDNAYPDGTYQEFVDYYEPTWGRFFNRTRPTPGNHDYNTAGAQGYFDYFGWRAGPRGRGYYSLKVGHWRVFALDSEACSTGRGCGPGSAQFKWLKKKLASTKERCTLAVWHHSLVSSGYHGNHQDVMPLYRLLYKAGAELVINGHDHDYERFAPIRHNGQLDRKHGIRQFVVGTGGAPLRAKGASDAAHSRIFESYS